jgi:hypothetical protein
MGASSILLSKGFDSLLITNGESLTFRGGSVRGLVNLVPFDKVVRSADFNPRDTSEIRVRSTAVTSVPRAGEEFIDGNSLRHRIQTVRRVGDYYFSRCEVSSVPTTTTNFLLSGSGVQLQTAAGVDLVAPN